MKLLYVLYSAMFWLVRVFFEHVIYFHIWMMNEVLDLFYSSYREYCWKQSNGTLFTPGIGWLLQVMFEYDQYGRMPVISNEIGQRWISNCNDVHWISMMVSKWWNQIFLTKTSKNVFSSWWILYDLHLYNVRMCVFSLLSFFFSLRSLSMFDERLYPSVKFILIKSKSTKYDCIIAFIGDVVFVRARYWTNDVHERFIVKQSTNASTRLTCYRWIQSMIRDESCFSFFY
jgi:hypothetical protein